MVISVLTEVQLTGQQGLRARGMNYNANTQWLTAIWYTDGVWRYAAGVASEFENVRRKRARRGEEGWKEGRALYRQRVEGSVDTGRRFEPGVESKGQRAGRRKLRSGCMAWPPSSSLGEHEQPAATLVMDGNQGLRVGDGCESTQKDGSGMGIKGEEWDSIRLAWAGCRRWQLALPPRRGSGVPMLSENAASPVHGIASSHCCHISDFTEQSRQPLRGSRRKCQVMGDVSGLGVYGGRAGEVWSKVYLSGEEPLALPNASNTPTHGVPIKSHRSFGWSSNLILTRGYHPPHPIPSLALWDGFKSHETGYKHPIRSTSYPTPSFSLYSLLYSLLSTTIPRSPTPGSVWSDQPNIPSSPPSTPYFDGPSTFTQLSPPVRQLFENLLSSRNMWSRYPLCNRDRLILSQDPGNVATNAGTAPGDSQQTLPSDASTPGMFDEPPPAQRAVGEAMPSPDRPAEEDRTPASHGVGSDDTGTGIAQMPEPATHMGITRIMQLGNPVGISLFANPVASPVMAPDPKSRWESADGHKRKERMQQEITIPHFVCVSTFGNVEYKRRVRGSFTAVLSALNAPNYKLQPGRLHQVGRAGKLMTRIFLFAADIDPFLALWGAPITRRSLPPTSRHRRDTVMGREGNQACTNILHAKCYGNPGYSTVTGLPNCIIRITRPDA
ncbi:hypothetical protein FA13DRAFT_1715781 [Coprinellus micaceus]|uniref:Uncharacterized protein n=1 Tax=Coprinellus micaceus TaxID=71717 RepID=A0A4Y7SMI9_COPMI|nr:hypothetical protein FA13DRAFT_1715781 [Coprinellus micaceus]